MTIENEIAGRYLRPMLFGMGSIALGTGVGRGLAILSMPLLTRLFGPEEFGMLALFTAAVSVLSPAVTLRLCQAIPVADNDDDAKGLLLFSIVSACCLSLVVFVIALSVSKLSSLPTAFVPLFDIWPLLLFGVLGAAFLETANMFATRERIYSLIAVSAVTEVLISLAVKAVSAFTLMKSTGLIVGQIVGTWMAAIVILMKCRSLRRGFFSLSRTNFDPLFEKYKDFPLFRLPNQILLSLCVQLPIFFIGTNFGVGSAGQLAVALTIINLPNVFLAKALSKTFFGELAGRKGNYPVWEIYTRLLTILSVFSFAYALAVFSFGQILTDYIFGEQWQQAGLIASIFAFYLPLSFSVNSLQPLLIVTHEHKSMLFITSARLFALLIIIVLTVKLDFSFLSYLKIHAVYVFLYNFVMICFITSKARKM